MELVAAYYLSWVDLDREDRSMKKLHQWPSQFHLDLGHEKEYEEYGLMTYELAEFSYP